MKMEKKRKQKQQTKKLKETQTTNKTKQKHYTETVEPINQILFACTVFKYIVNDSHKN